MRHFTTRFFYTISDLVESKGREAAPLNVPFNSLRELLSTLSQTTINNITLSEELDKLWKEYLWFRFNNAFVVYVDVEHSPWTEPVIDPAELEVAVQQWCALVIAWINETSVRYIPLIKGYEEIKNNLLDTINSESTVLFNDTPQSAGDWLSDPYTTNATKTSSKQEIATPVERLREIDTKLMSLYSEWSDTFRRLVIR